MDFGVDAASTHSPEKKKTYFELDAAGAKIQDTN
jgi:hypothetical protein